MKFLLSLILSVALFVSVSGNIDWSLYTDLMGSFGDFYNNPEIYKEAKPGQTCKDVFGPLATELVSICRGTPTGPWIRTGCIVVESVKEWHHRYSMYTYPAVMSAPCENNKRNCANVPTTGWSLEGGSGQPTTFAHCS